jgi:hypothetical protein
MSQKFAVDTGDAIVIGIVVLVVRSAVRVVVVVAVVA